MHPIICFEKKKTHGNQKIYLTDKSDLNAYKSTLALETLDLYPNR